MAGSSSNKAVTPEKVTAGPKVDGKGGRGRAFMEGKSSTMVSTRTKAGLLTVAAMLLTAGSSADVRLQKKTTDAYDLYVRTNEARLQAELAQTNQFLWFDFRPEGKQREIQKELRDGQVYVEHIRLDLKGKKIEIPDGLVHHWVGLVFIPGATVNDVLKLVQDYDKHAKVYSPEVMQSRTLERNGDNYRVFFRFLKKKVLTAVLNTDHEVHYLRLGPGRAASRSWTTRVQEVEDAGKPSEREKPVGDDSGFMWRLDTWWRFEERDGGTYVQCETVSLSRDIPYGLGWVVGPIVKSIPKESLAFSLGTTRSTLLTRLAQAGRTSTATPSN